MGRPSSEHTGYMVHVVRACVELQARFIYTSPAKRSSCTTPFTPIPFIAIVGAGVRSHRSHFWSTSCERERAPYARCCFLRKDTHLLPINLSGIRCNVMPSVCFTAERFRCSAGLVAPAASLKCLRNRRLVLVETTSSVLSSRNSAGCRYSDEFPGTVAATGTTWRDH